MKLQGRLRRIGAGARTREFRHDLRKCKLGFLNVRTLHVRREVVQGAIDGVGEEKLELLKVRMQECGLCVLALSEVWLPDQGVTTFHDGIFSIAEGVGSQGGTALSLSPAAASAWRAAGCQSCAHPSGRVASCTLQLAGQERRWTTIGVHGPTFRAEEADILGFWTSLVGRLHEATGTTCILGDFNCRVGSARPGEQPDPVLSLHGLVSCNPMEERMLQFCRRHSLRIMNTFHLHQKAPWYHPRGRNPGILDYCLVHTRDAHLVTNVRMHFALEVDSDHKLGVVKCRVHVVLAPSRRPISLLSVSILPPSGRRLCARLVMLLLFGCRRRE